jgi:hypothetical protein
MFTFEQLFEAVNPNRNPRFKLDVGDAVVVKDIITTAGYEPKKNQSMAGKQGTVIARYPYSMSLKIGVDFGDGKEYKFNSQYLERVLQPDDAVPVDKRIDILDKAVSKSGGIIEKYDEQKHQQINQANLAYLTQMAQTLKSAAAGSSNLGTLHTVSSVLKAVSSTSLKPLFVVNFPSNLIFPVHLVNISDATNAAAYAAALSLLNLTIATNTPKLSDDRVFVETGAQGCTVIFYHSSAATDLFMCALEPSSGWPASLIDQFAYHNVSNFHYHNIDRPINSSLLYYILYSLTPDNAKNDVKRHFSCPATYAVGTSYYTSVTHYKQAIAAFIKLIKGATSNQSMIRGQMQGVKAFGPDLIMNFDRGRLQSTQQDPSVVMKITDVEALLWIDDNEYNQDRQPNSIIKQGADEYFCYEDAEGKSFIFTQQTKQQIVDTNSTLFRYACQGSLGSYLTHNLKANAAVDNNATINIFICKKYTAVKNLKFLLPYNDVPNQYVAVVSENNLNKLLNSNISDADYTNLIDAVSLYLQLKNQYSWPDSNYICLAPYESRESGFQGVMLPSNIIQSVERRIKFKSQIRQDIGDDLADIGDMF